MLDFDSFMLWVCDMLLYILLIAALILRVALNMYMLYGR